jgi:nickel superoxide dismutase
MKRHLVIAMVALFSFSTASRLSAHCQVPCGIYSDDTVLKDLQTHQATIAKAMAQIIELSKDPAKNANQIARWVVNKEQHASKIQDTMTRYFLAQRIKLDEAASNKEAYLKKVTLVHKIIVHAMKCKQGTDVKNAEILHQAIDSFTQAYSAK